jgi:hypothetical protein
MADIDLSVTPLEHRGAAHVNSLGFDTWVRM